LHKIESEDKIENFVLLGKKNTISRKNYSLFALSLGASYIQRTSEFEFSSHAEEMLFSAKSVIKAAGKMEILKILREISIKRGFPS